MESEGAEAGTGRGRDEELLTFRGGKVKDVSVVFEHVNFLDTWGPHLISHLRTR